MGNRLGERQPEPRAFVRTAGVEPSKSPPRLFASFRRNSGPAVGDLDADGALTGFDADADLATGCAVAQRIFDEVAYRLGEQLPMPEQWHRPSRPVVNEARVPLLGKRIVHFGELLCEFADVEPGKLAAPGLRLRSADLQDGSQDSHQRVRLADDAAEQFFLLSGIAGLRCGMKETGCAAVKLEGGEAMAPTIEFLTHRGIPVIGHVGLTPQAVNVLGGYGARGREDAEKKKIIDDARAVDQAGAFCIVVEGVLEGIANDITKAVAAPVIGIGASAQCDGQVLVTDDMLGMFERTPRFVKRYDDLAGRIGDAVRNYADEVRSRSFPTADQTYQPK